MNDEQLTQIQSLVVQALGDAIKDLGSVPAGHLYAQVMHHLSLQQFDRVIDVLIARHQVRRDGNHLLTWIGEK